MLLEKLIFLLFFGIPIVDTLNGYLIRNDLFNYLGIIYKNLLLLLLFLYLIKKTKKNLIRLLIVLLLIPLLLIYTHIFLEKLTSFKDILIDLSWPFKFLLFLLTFLFLINSTHFSIEKIIFLSKWYLFVYSINIILGFLGIGYHQYYGNIGGIGFIYAGNELSITLVYLFAILALHFWSNCKYIKFILLYISSLIIAILKATKTALLGINLIFYLIIFLHFLYFKHIKRKGRILFSFLSLYPIIITISIFILLFKVGLISRIEYWFNHASLISVILSSRNLYLNTLISNISNDFNLISFLVGHSLPYISKVHLTEMDLIDIFFAYGFLGIIYFYLPIFFIFFYLLKIKTFPSRIIQLIVILSLTISTLAGHVLNSGIANIPLSFLFLLAFKKR